MRILSSTSLEGMERRHWETHCRGSFYGARLTSNLLQAQRLPCRPIARLRGLPHRRPHNHLLHHRLRRSKGPRVLQLLLHQKKGKKKIASLPMAGPSKKKQKTVERKLTYKKTAEELEEETARYIKEQLKIKVPSPREN